MARRRRQQQVSVQEEDDDPPAPPAGGGRVIAIAGVFLAIGFVSGYFVGADGAKAPAAPAVVTGGPFAGGGSFASGPAGGAAGPFAGGGSGMPAGGLAPAVLPPPHKGHTFTGDIEVPPHSEAAHQLADVLLRDVTCPCGGCEKMTLGTCTCDTSREVAGFAAHLLERGKHGDEVLTSLAPRYGLSLTPQVLAQAKTIVLANPQFADAMPAGMPASAMSEAMPDTAQPAAAQPAAALPRSGSAALDGLEALSEMGHADPGVQRLVDVPTSARPGNGSTLASTVLDPSGFPAAAESYAIARKIPEVLAGILCGCGCSKTLGHQSLLTCYQSAHASTCPICQKEAHEAAALAAQGLSVSQIRSRLHAEYGLPGA